MARMSDERMIRVENLELLLRLESLSRADLHRHLEVSDTYVSKLFSGKPGTFGEKAARKIEAKFKKPRFWLDMVHAGVQYSPQSLQQQRPIESDADAHVHQVAESVAAYTNTEPINARAITLPMAPVLDWADLGDALNRANKHWPASDLRAVPTQRAVSDKVKWIPVQDDALAPKLLPGDLVAIDPCGHPQHDEVALFKTSDGCFLLRRYVPLADGGFEAIDSSGRVLDSARHGIICVGSFAGLFRDNV